MANQLYGSTDQIGEILRRMRQYSALRGTNMPQTTQTALFEGMGKAASQDASRRYYQDLASRQAARAAEQRDKALKMAQENQDAQSLQGWLGLGYRAWAANRASRTCGARPRTGGRGLTTFLRPTTRLRPAPLTWATTA